MVIVGFVLGILFWFLESALHLFVFGKGGWFMRELFFPDWHEFWMRSIVTMMFISFGIYAQKVINRRIEIEEKYREQNEFLNHIIESLTYPFYVVDVNDYMIKIANVAARRGGDLKKDGYCYLFTHKSSVPCSSAEHLCPLDEVKKTKKPVVTEHIHYDEKGNFKNVEVHGYPIFNKRGEVIQMIEYTLDVTQRKKAERDLRESREKLRGTLRNLEKTYEKLQEVDKMKSDFISIVSHELRTPLTSIKNAVSILLGHARQRENKDKREEELLTIISKNTDRQTRMVNNLLDASKIEAGVMRMDIQHVDIVNLAKDVINSFQFRLEDKKIIGKLISEKDSLFVFGDYDQLMRVFDNLMSNAVQFTPKNGEVIVKIEKDIPAMIKVTVADTGIGVPEKDIEKLFNKFYQVDSEDSHRKNGTGLGLAITKGIIEAHGGKIWVDSKFKKGTSFYFTLRESVKTIFMGINGKNEEENTVD